MDIDTAIRPQAARDIRPLRINGQRLWDSLMELAAGNPDLDEFARRRASLLRRLGALRHDLRMRVHEDGQGVALHEELVDAVQLPVRELDGGARDDQGPHPLGDVERDPCPIDVEPGHRVTDESARRRLDGLERLGVLAGVAEPDVQDHFDQTGNLVRILEPELLLQPGPHRLGVIVEAPDEPFALFHQWFNDAVKTEQPPVEANAMTLATVDQEGRPHCRVLLLKGLDRVLAAIEAEVGLPVLAFPKEREYFVGLRLPVDDDECAK